MSMMQLNLFAMFSNKESSPSHRPSMDQTENSPFVSHKHYNHDVSWSFVSTRHEHLVCIACLIEQMENEELSAVQKKVALSMFSTVVKDVKEVTEMFRHNLHVSKRVIYALTVLFKDKELFVDPAVEACYSLLMNVQREDLTEFFMAGFEEQLLTVSEVNQIKPYLLLLGQLVASSDEFASYLLLHHETLLLELTSLTDSAESDVQSSVMFVLVHVFSNTQQTAISPVLRRRVCTSVITILNEAESLELQINLLALLKKLVRDGDSAVLLIQLTPSNQTLILALKKMFITKKEVLQTATAQCIFGLLNIADTTVFVKQLLESDVIEFLFESLHTQNASQLESLFKVLHTLTSFEPFFTRCHAVYGVESVLMAIGVLIRTNNLKIEEKAFMLLDSLLVRQPSSIPLFVNTATALHCLSIIEQGLHSNYLPLFVQVLSCTQHVLRELYLPRPYPFSTVHNMLRVAVNKLSDVFQDPSEELIHLYSMLVSTVASLCQAKLAIASKETSAVSAISSCTDSEDDITAIKNLMLELIEEHLLPWICKKWADSDTVVQKDVFHCFNSLYGLDRNKMAEFSTRVAWSGVIIKVIVLKSWAKDDLFYMKSILDEFLLNVFTQLVERDVLMYTELPDWFQHGLENLTLSTWELSVILEVENTEIFQVLLAVLYFSYIYGFVPWSAEDLLQIINSFLVRCVDFGLLPPLCLKYCLFLCSWAQSDSDASDKLYHSQAFRHLLTTLSSCSLEAWYTHHPVMIMWSFSNQLLSDSWGVQLLEYWIPTINMDSLKSLSTQDPDIELLGDLMYSENFLNSLLTVLVSAKENLSNTAAEVTNWIISKLEMLVNEGQETAEAMLKFLYQKCSEILHDFFLQQSETSEYQLVNILGVVTTLMSEGCKQEESDHLNLKSVYHVVKYIANVSDIENAGLYQCLQYLLKFSETSEPDNNRVVPVMTQNMDFMLKLNQCLTSGVSTLVSTVSRIMSWMSTYKGEINVTSPIEVSADCILKALNSSSNELTLGLLSLVSAALTPDKHNTSLLVFTRSSLLDNQPFFTPKDDDTTVRKFAVDCVQRLLKYAASTYGDLENQLLSHPWNKLWLETLIQFDTDYGVSDETVSLVIMLSQKKEGEKLVTHVCDLLLRCLSVSCLSPLSASLLTESQLLDKPFMEKCGQKNLITAAKENLTKISSVNESTENQQKTV